MARKLKKKVKIGLYILIALLILLIILLSLKLNNKKEMDNKPKENVQFNHPEVKDTFIRHSKVYASLKKYHEHVLNEYYKLCYPCSRPVFFHYDEDF